MATRLFLVQVSYVLPQILPPTVVPQPLSAVRATALEADGVAVRPAVAPGNIGARGQPPDDLAPPERAAFLGDRHLVAARM